MNIWMSSSLPLQLPTTHHRPPSSSSLPAHYPCHTGPGPTWHSLVDLIELDIPACLGIVWWHENLPAISMKAEEKRGIGNTCRKIWELEILRDGRAAAKRRTTSPPIVPRLSAKCRMGLVQGCHFIWPRGVAKSRRLTSSETLLEKFYRDIIQKL